MEHKNLYGIDEAKPVFRFIGGMVTTIVNIDQNKDGNISAWEGFLAAQKVVTEAIPAYPDVEVFLKEVKDLTEEEIDELVEELAARLLMRTAKTSIIVRRVIAILMNIADVIIDVRRPNEDFEAR